MELQTLKTYHNEKELIEVVERIGDKIMFKGYQESDAILLANELINIDILSLQYTAREQILSVLCDVVSNYDIKSKIDLSKIMDIKSFVEDDLKEYIDDFLS